MKKKTKIVATLGPATNTPYMLERLIRAGMDMARMNLSHGTLANHSRLIETIRNLNRQLGSNVSILIDLPGAKYRIGTITGGQAILKKGALITLTTENIVGDNHILPVNLPNLPRDAKPGDTVLLADGALQLRVEETTASEVKCRVVTGGVIETGKGVVIPGRHISEPYITISMRKDILFAAQQHPDYLALSFVSSAEDVRAVKEILQEANVTIPCISKIEREEAFRAFDKILAVSDAVMVARGDLGVEIPLEKVPIIQKEIIRKCNRAGKPVITATEMLESMITSARPTRAETTDVANAIFDGTDAVMLSGETAIGKFPVLTVKMMSKIAVEAEKTLPYEKMLIDRGNWIEPETGELISYNACLTARRLKAVAIVAYTQSGSTPPSIPVQAGCTGTGANTERRSIRPTGAKLGSNTGKTSDALFCG